MEIVQKEPGKTGWQLLPKRWVVERTFAWFYRQRTLWRNVEAKRVNMRKQTCLSVWSD